MIDEYDLVACQPFKEEITARHKSWTIETTLGIVHKSAVKEKEKETVTKKNVYSTLQWEKENKTFSFFLLCTITLAYVGVQKITSLSWSSIAGASVRQ